MQSLLDQLCDWYQSNCDEDWEHQYGVKIETLDNPGWMITIDLTWTELETKLIPEFEAQRSKHDWLFAKELKNNNGRTYYTAGGPHNLEEMIQRFLDWTENAQNKA